MRALVISRNSLERSLRRWENRRRLWVALALIISLAQLRWWWTPVVPMDDTATYQSIAWNLAHGRFERFGEPYYAIAYPMLIAPAYWISDRPYFAISVIHSGLLFATAVGLLAWFRRLCIPAAGLLMLLVLVHRETWVHTWGTLRELPLTCALVWTAVAIPFHHGRIDATGPIWRWCAAAVLLAYAVMNKEIAGVLVAATGLLLLREVRDGQLAWRRGLAALSILAIPAVLVIALQAIPPRTSGGGPLRQTDLLSPSSGWTDRIQTGILSRAAGCGELLIPRLTQAAGWRGVWNAVVLTTPAWVLIYSALLALILTGWALLALRRPDPLLWAFPFYMLVLVVLATYPQGVRYVFPMWPVIAVSIWVLLMRVPRWRLQLSVLFIAAHLFASGHLWWRKANEGLELHRDWPAVEQAAATLPAHARHIASYDLNHFRHVQMFQLVLNRRLEELYSLSNVPREIRWLICPTELDSELPADFTTHAVAGPWMVLRRDKSPIEPGSSQPRAGEGEGLVEPVVGALDVAALAAGEVLGSGLRPP